MIDRATSLTNFALVIECAGFALALALRERSRMRDAWIEVFAFLALGSACGGLVHGWFPDEHTLPYRVLWPLSVVFVIAAATALAQVALEVASPGRRSALRRLIYGVAVAFGLVLLMGYQDFRLAIAAYVLASIAFVATLGRRAAQERSLPYALGVVGILGSIVAGGLQQAGYTPLPGTLSHNAFYHLLQLAALALVFVAAFRLTAPLPGEAHARPS